MITPQSEIFFRSGLAKSAFKEAVYKGLPLDFFIPGIERTYRLALLNHTRPKFYQSHDLFMLMYMPYTTVYASLKEKNKAAPAWRSFIEGLIMRPEYIKLNEMTQWSMELAAAAAAAIFARLGKIQVPNTDKTLTMDEMNEAVKSLANGAVPPGLEDAAAAAGGAQALLRQLEKAAREQGKAAAQELKEVAKELKEYMEAKQEAEAAASALAGAGGQGYNLEGISIWHFYKRPDEFRNRVRILVGAALAFKRFTKVLPNSLDQTMMGSLWGGIDGVDVMREYSQLKDATPAELALANASRLLFALKLAQKSIVTYKRAMAMRYVVFVDKSGSMADWLTAEPGSLGPGDHRLMAFLGKLAVPKISLAAGLALALKRRLQNVDIYLFDTEVDKVSSREVVQTLLSIRADGGTNIQRVMEEILRIDRPDNMYIIISDGITDADDGIVKRFMERCGSRTKLILVPPSGEHYKWVQELKRRGNVAHAHNVAQFEEAARKLLAS
jgi:uncharacterized protein with von Willebrand factor type A (vWA) domain